MSVFLAQVEREIKRLSREREFLSRRINALEAVRQEYLRDEANAPARPKAGPQKSGRVEKITAAMKQAQGPLHYRDIIKALENAGEQFPGVKDRGATITATLSLHRDVFKRVGKGTYVLIENEEGQAPASGETGESD